MAASPRPGRKRPTSNRWAGLAAGLVVPIGFSGCGSTERSGSAPAPSPPAALLAQARPIGQGAAFRPPVRGSVLGPCRGRLGARAGVHVEVFAANRVVLIPAGIGTRSPRSFSSGRISSASCYGELVTLEPTGVVLVRRGARLRLDDLFRSWGQALSSRRLASFTAPKADQIRAYVDGRRWRGPVARVPLRVHSEIVLEVGAYVPPHAAYTFPPGY